jgi:ligand-binding sensor domain-containing protein
MKNGLSSNYCYDVKQDDLGNIWIATLNGLNKFDGTRWDTYQQQKKQNYLPSNWMVDLENAQNAIYVNGIKGISKINIDK